MSTRKHDILRCDEGYAGPTWPALALLLGLAIVAPTALGQAERTLVHRFQPGQQLVYQHRLTIETLDGTPRGQHRLQTGLWCLDRQGPRLHVLLTTTRDVAGAPPLTLGIALEMDTTGAVTLAADLQKHLLVLEDSLPLLPQLPLAVQGEDTWNTTTDYCGRVWHCDNRGADPAHKGHIRIDYRVEDRWGALDVVEQDVSGTFWFDPAAGHVSRLDTSRVDHRRQRRIRNTAVLQETDQYPATWAARRMQEATRYCRSLRHEARALRSTLRSTQRATDRLRDALHVWSALRSDIDGRDDNPFVTLVDGRGRWLRSRAKLWDERARLAADWLGKPARPWTLPDAEQQMLTSEAARSGITIECYWSSATRWSLRTLEILRRMQADLPRGVHMLCYNLDVDPVRSAQAIEHCGRDLRHVLAAPLQLAAPLPETPIVRIVDDAGVVRDLWPGWRLEYDDARERATRLARAADL